MSVLVLMFLGCLSLIFFLFCLRPRLKLMKPARSGNFPASRHISGVVGFSRQDLETSRRFVVGFSGGCPASSSGGGACDRLFFFLIKE